jgi:spermidine synthase
MDTAETSTERLVADVVLDRHPTPRHVLVAGLGLGVTLGTLLADVRVERVDVIEIEPLVVEWLRSGIGPSGRGAVRRPAGSCPRARRP